MREPTTASADHLLDIPPRGIVELAIVADRLLAALDLYTGMMRIRRRGCDGTTCAELR